jgi:hypothetical protein
MKHLQNIQSFLISESDIDSMIAGFEELGINKVKKLAFIEYYVQEEYNHSGELLIIEGNSSFEIVESFLYNAEFEKSEIEEILSEFSEEKFDSYNLGYLMTSHRFAKEYTIDNFWIIDHPKPGSDGFESSFNLNSIEQFLEADRKIKNEFGFGMADLIKFPQT